MGPGGMSAHFFLSVFPECLYYGAVPENISMIPIYTTVSPTFVSSSSLSSSPSNLILSISGYPPPCGIQSQLYFCYSFSLKGLKQLQSLNTHTIYIIYLKRCCMWELTMWSKPIGGSISPSKHITPPLLPLTEYIVSLLLTVNLFVVVKI